MNVRTAANTDRFQKEAVIRNNALFRSCITKINIVMHNLLEYSNKYSMTSERLWNYYRNKIDAVANDASEGISFKHKTKIVKKNKKEDLLGLDMKEMSISHSNRQYHL